jgi:omega-6 fatty acid desaturase (delta-12 desaturase)
MKPTSICLLLIKKKTPKRILKMNLKTAKEIANSTRKAWRQAVAPYSNPDIKRSIWQLINTLVPYFLLWVLMYWSLDVSYWFTLLLSIPAAGFMVRAFIIFHDCGHGSFFRSRKGNAVVGYITGIITFTPYDYWRHNHAIHHATAGDLDRRGTGDVWTATVEEYLSFPAWKRLFYRFYRNPVVMFLISPVLLFGIGHRFMGINAKQRERASVYWTNLTLLGILLLAHFTIGLKAYILIQLPILWIGTAVGVWLFYVQHNFDGVYWERHEDWDFVKAGLEGSSFYKLPKVLQWFTGNIGFHHIHHLSPRIPNYLLERCHLENPIFQIRPITLLSSVKSLTFRLWDEKSHQLVGYRWLKSDGVVS